MDQKYKSVLIVNEASDAEITFYDYLGCDPICWLSYSSKIIKPKDKYYYRTVNAFRFRLVAQFKDGKKKKTVLELEKWTEDKLITVTDSLDIIEGTLADFPHEKQLCVRKVNRDNELSAAGGGRNLYEILKLDIDKVRKMPPEEQKKVIKRAFHREIRRWHPDHNFGDDENAREILMAYDVLGDPEARARYNNLADYDSGRLSPKHYKAIFWPDCNTEEQTWAYRKRMCLLAVSVGLALAGIITTAFTAGAAAPAWVVAGGIFGGGFAGAGLQSLSQTVNRETIADGCDFNKWAGKAVIGYVGGTITGGAVVGIAAGITGIGITAVKSAAASVGQYIGVGAATGATGGVVSSLASDAARKLVDGQDVTWKQVVGHVVCGGAVGALAGVAGGAVTKAVVGGHTSATAANLEGEIGEQVVIRTGAIRLKDAFVRNLTENSTDVVMGSAAQFVEERLDDSVENRIPTEHLVEGVKKVVKTAVKDMASNFASAVVAHAFNERKVTKKMKNDKKTEGTKNDGTVSPIGISNEAGDEKLTRREFKQIVHKENNRTSWKGCSRSPTFQADFTEGIEPTSGIRTLPRANLETLVETDDDEDLPPDGHIKYISTGRWWSRMVVTYDLDSENKTEEVRGSGKCIDISARARNIKVKFQVMRPGWGDVLKYDRFQQCWCKPYEAHVFMFDIPPVRTFTISGSLHWEAVMKTTDGYHDETLEM